jgi:hypothetical protein
MSWTYGDGYPFTEDPTNYFGFVYIITNLDTGRQYIGRKLFTKAKIKAKTKTTRKKKLRVASDWENYYGSSQELLDDIKTLGKEKFSREILRLCKGRGETNYWEAYEILTRGALLSDKYYNKWVSLKLHKSTLQKSSISPSK